MNLYERNQEKQFLREMIADHTQPIMERLAECEAALIELGGEHSKYFLRWKRLPVNGDSK